MTDIQVTIGWTRSDMANGYSSFGDGYKPGAQQHTEVVTVEIERAGWEDFNLALGETAKFVHMLAERSFTALNHPDPERFDPDSLAGQIYSQLRDRGFNGSQSGHYSLSVGDTVTVGEVTLACANTGWERVTITPKGI